ncbi:histone-lysine N-methyltransferase, H3 lysine-9 specific SUVH6-like [Iris pallida]|uniref:Histone-lysine N-methyltransferase, H3 lysine-9 specific SUVH6-like n=1 Tax=Iris pallida TaxID=29817 RepID=A0AAX6G8Z0_IRIPA|nr:histone-lysine N-methyltransferase, H3 lysine-9 specific SUVH6-like [Iris pallida]
MLKAIPPLPAKFKRRSVSAVRTFPKGCRVRASASIAAGTPAPVDPSVLNPLKAEEAEESHASTLPPPEENGIEKAPVGNEGVGQNDGELVASDELRGSMMPEKMAIEHGSGEKEGMCENNGNLVASDEMEIEKGFEEKEGVGENNGNLVASDEMEIEKGFEEKEGVGENNGELANTEEAAEESNGLMPLEKEIEKGLDEGMGQTNGNLEASELPNGAEPETSELPAESLCLLELGSRKYAPPKRRRVSVVRHFPSGCGRNAPKIGTDKSVMAASSESKTTGKKKLAVGVGPTKEDDDDEVRRSDGGNEAVAENSIVKNEDDVGKKKGELIRETGGKKLEVGVRSTEDEVMRRDVVSHAVVKSSPEKDEDDLGKKNSVPIRERKIHDSSGECRFKSPKPRNSEGKTSGKNSQGNGVKQVSKNLQVKESRDARPQSGIKTGKSPDNVYIKSPKDGSTLKRKLSEEGEDEDHVMGVKSRGKEPLEAYRDSSIVPALKTATSSRPVTPKFKAKDKLKILSYSDGKGKSLVINKKSQSQSVHPNQDRDSGSNQEGSSARDMVKRTLRLFQKLLQEEEATNSKGGRRGDLKAASILKESNNWVNYGTPIIGDVPGVEVGDEFHWRVELSIIGLHRPFQGGIDYMKRGDGKILATSIVASGGYPTNLESSDELIYSGSGGNPDSKKKKEAGDQKLERGNLALKNSIDAKTPVRVIYGAKLQNKSDYNDGRAKTTFTYDGLYLVEEYWAEAGPRGFSVFKFKLRRLPRNQSTREDSDSDRE